MNTSRFLTVLLIICVVVALLAVFNKGIDQAIADIRARIEYYPYFDLSRSSVCQPNGDFLFCPGMQLPSGIVPDKKSSITYVSGEGIYFPMKYINDLGCKPVDEWGHYYSWVVYDSRGGVFFMVGCDNGAPWQMTYSFDNLICYCQRED